MIPRTGKRCAARLFPLSFREKGTGGQYTERVSAAPPVGLAYRPWGEDGDKRNRRRLRFLHYRFVLVGRGRCRFLNRPAEAETGAAKVARGCAHRAAHRRRDRLHNRKP